MVGKLVPQEPADAWALLSTLGWAGFGQDGLSSSCCWETGVGVETAAHKGTLSRLHLLLLSMTLFCTQHHGSKQKRHREWLRRPAELTGKQGEAAASSWVKIRWAGPWLNAPPQNPPGRQPSGSDLALM